MLRVCGIAGLLLVACIGVAPVSSAQDMRAPRIVATETDWKAVSDTLYGHERPTDTAKALAGLNDLTNAIYPAIAASPVPVLLPFDTSDLLRDKAEGNAARTAIDYATVFKRPDFFQAGSGGYDAAYTIHTRDNPELGVQFSERVVIQISGSSLLYELGEPSGLTGMPVNGLESEFPGIRRLMLENVIRYTFVRFGVPYVVAIECYEATRFRKISCRSTDKSATRFLKALQVAGGLPTYQPVQVTPTTIERPDAISADFKYHAPGDLIPGSGTKGNAGHVDYTVYSKIRFPIANGPAFANSQSFMNWGDCDQTGRVGLGRQGNTTAYRCRVNNLPLVGDEGANGNYAYPWRDNFCEHRSFFVGECPAGLGHQGQDIRPGSCKQRSAGASRCEPYQHDVVAVRDGLVLRAPGQSSLHIVVNAPGERLRFRYLHMLPQQLDRNEVIHGHTVREGEVIGQVGNYLKRENATTYHLHFDIQVPTRYGWVFVNPYVTLVSAYERLIGGRGHEVKDPPNDDFRAEIKPVAAPHAGVQQLSSASAPDAANPVQSGVQSDANDRIAAEKTQDETTLSKQSKSEQ